MNTLPLIPLLPLFGGLLLTILYVINLKIMPIKNGVISFIAVLTPLCSTIIAIYIFFIYSGKVEVVNLFNWIDTSVININIAFQADTLSIFMALFVSFISTLIHLYSVGYMKDDDCYAKFFIYMNLFVASMLVLVLADNPFLMFLGWEGVGICSYLLISYYYEDSDNAIAGSKAFIVNRVGDFAFLAGLVILFWQAGALSFTFSNVAGSVAHIDPIMRNFIAFLLFIGATAKSAQIPLYTWLPDAMAGPTPVSALIHAATMVTAGLYMVARYSFLYTITPDIGELIAIVGGITAFVAAIVATRQTDIKKILAYSTMSQLGYMFMAVGIGSYSAGLFHVLTHAFFKATLFLGAGSIIFLLHHEQDVFKMGNLKKNRVIYFTMLIATLSISGIPPFAGFFSKDEIMYRVFVEHSFVVYALALITAGLTSYYMFRLFFLVFHANDREHHYQVVPKVMGAVLVILSIGIVIVGFLGLPDVMGPNLVGEYLDKSMMLKVAGERTTSNSQEIWLMVINVIVGLIGIAIAYFRFYKYKEREYRENFFARAVRNKFYIDELYDTVFVKGMNLLSVGFIHFNILIIDKVVTLANGLISVTSKYYTIVFQDGRIKTYIYIMSLSMIIMIIYLIDIGYKG